MSYSLSQLDAIGDVDPVAEADVYLAYGRDLQAEEILKEAMRGNPERMAIRMKLLEVYAKRRDIKGFELLAASCIRSRGARARTGPRRSSSAPDRPGQPALPAGRPSAGRGDRRAARSSSRSAPARCRIGLPSPSRRPLEARRSDRRRRRSTSTSISAPELPTRRRAASARSRWWPPRPRRMPTPVDALEFDRPGADARCPDAPTSRRRGLASATRLDPPPEALEAAPARRLPDLGSLDLPGVAEADPLSRKLELAEEFRQIGDMEGARDLLQEVLADGQRAAR